MSLGSNEMDRVRSFRKIFMRLRATKFCTSSACFALSFVSQPNGSKCTKIVRNAPKHQLRVQWGGSGAFLAENSDATSCTNFCTSSARFAPSFVRQPFGCLTKLDAKRAELVQKFVHEVASQFSSRNAPNPPHWTLS